ncbi:hypothetical protein ACLOJK_003080 [Asimina triloba]
MLAVGLKIKNWLMSADEDRLSNLPPHVLEAILVLLPLRDAVRTSILSSKWRYTWTAIPHLVFDSACAPPHSKNPALNRLRHVNIVDQVLLHHEGPIVKFESSWSLETCPDIDRWILFLSNHGIQHLSLKGLFGRNLKVPSRLLSCQQLRYLELGDCIILNPPPTISRLPNLKTLLLVGWDTLTNVSLKRLLSTCEFLEELKLSWLHGQPHLEILAPNLKKVHLHGPVQDLLFDTPLLASAKINVFTDEEENGQMGESSVCNLIKVFGALRCIQKLRLHAPFLKFLASGKVPKKLAIAYKHLEYLSLDIDFSDVNEMSIAFCLITSAPYLQKLKIHSMAAEMFGPHEFAWEAPGFKLNCLHSMEISDIIGGKNELDLLEFVLANAPVLSTMTVRMGHCHVFFLTDGGSEIYNDARRNSTEESIKLCLEGELQGIVSEVRGIFRNPRMIQRMKEANLSLLTYGQLNNVPKAVYMQHLMGVDGVIVDLVKEISEAVVGFSKPASTEEKGHVREVEEQLNKISSPKFSQQELSFLLKRIPELSRLYRCFPATIIFLMNNICYVVEKVKDLELERLLGEKWMRKHDGKFQQHALNYERISWIPVISLLTIEGTRKPRSNKVSMALVKDRFKVFNLAFEEIYRTQNMWLIQNAQLRDHLRTCISSKLFLAYRSFSTRFSPLAGRYFKFSAEDLVESLLVLFEGLPNPLHRAHRQ